MNKSETTNSLLICNNTNITEEVNALPKNTGTNNISTERINEREKDRDVLLLKNENKEMKEANSKLVEKIKDLDRKIKIAGIKVEQVNKYKKIFIMVIFTI